jgi:hypothetical protein
MRFAVALVFYGCSAGSQPVASEMDAPASAQAEGPAASEPAAPGSAGAAATPAAVGGAAGTNSASEASTPSNASGTSSASPPTGASAAGASGVRSADGPAGTGAAGAGGASGASETNTAGSPSAGSPATPPTEREDLGQGDGSDVVTIGDSWMSFFANGGGIEAGLRAASMQPYRNYGVAGTMLLDEVIPNQYAAAKRDNPDIKTVVMTGGGNDLLLTGMAGGSGCTESCMSTIDKVAARLEALWQEMGDDGVQDLVYIEYSQGGDNGASVAYGHTKLVPLCEATAPLRCHLLHSDDFIMMMLLDGVHPTADGCSKLGQATYDLMEQQGMRR